MLFIKLLALISCHKIWLIFFEIWMVLGHLAVGYILYITIIGIPFGKQFFKLAKLPLTPFGAQIININKQTVEADIEHGN